MKHRGCIRMNRASILRYSRFIKLYVVTLVFLFGSIGLSCGEGNNGAPTNAGSTGTANTATAVGNTGGTNTATTIGNVGNSGSTSTATIAGTGGTSAIIGNAGTAGNASTVTGAARTAADCPPNGNYWDITYNLAKSDVDPETPPADPPTNQNVLMLRDTMMSMGDANKNIGPGTATVRFQNVNGKPGGKAYLLQFELKQDFTVSPATTNLVATTGHGYTKGPCSSSAVGNVQSDTLTWSDFAGTAQGGTGDKPNVHGYFTDGTITCDGALCGSFGAPPQGTTPRQGGPFDIRVAPWKLAADASSFFMPSSITQQDLNSTTHIQVYGVESGRECKSIQACE